MTYHRVFSIVIFLLGIFLILMGADGCSRFFVPDNKPGPGGGYGFAIFAGTICIVYTIIEKLVLQLNDK
jgi:hypothetical protein